MEMLCIFINIQIACLTCRRNRTLNGVTAPVKLLAVRPCLLLLPYCIRTRIHTHNHIQADGLPFTAADSGRHVRPAVGRHVHFAWNSREFATKSQIQLALCAVVPHACLFLLYIWFWVLCRRLQASSRTLISFASKQLVSRSRSASHLVPICILKWQMLHAKYVQHAACRMPMLRAAYFVAAFAW